jgi:hypothetical protein
MSNRMASDFSELQKNEVKRLESLSRVQNRTPSEPSEVCARRVAGYSCGKASGCIGTAEATGPGPAPSR